jgi:hypothetical protein
MKLNTSRSGAPPADRICCASGDPVPERRISDARSPPRLAGERMKTV